MTEAALLARASLFSWFPVRDQEETFVASVNSLGSGSRGNAG